MLPLSFNDLLVQSLRSLDELVVPSPDLGEVNGSLSGQAGVKRLQRWLRSSAVDQSLLSQHFGRLLDVAHPVHEVLVHPAFSEVLLEFFVQHFLFGFG